MGSSKGTCNNMGPNVFCNLGDIPRGGVVTISIQTIPTVVGAIENQASVRADQKDPDHLNNKVHERTIVLPNKADLQLIKRDKKDPVLVGGYVTYTITVINEGPQDATQVVFTDNLILSQDP